MEGVCREIKGVITIPHLIHFLPACFSDIIIIIPFRPLKVEYSLRHFVNEAATP